MDDILNEDLNTNDLPEELQLETEEDTNERMDRLAEAMAQEESRNEKELRATTEAEALDAEAELAQQIAEDEALEKELKAEAEQEETESLTPLVSLTEEGQLEPIEFQSAIETLLFLSDKPMTQKRLKEILAPGLNGNEFQEQFQEAIATMKARYDDNAHGFELAEVAGGYQFRTKLVRAEVARKLAKVQTQRLSRGAMETLAIVAYRQPVMKDEIDQIRGVDSSHFIRGLMEKKLIHISGRSELPGRPMLYSTSQDFLEVFGLADLSALPPLRELESMIPSSQSSNPEDEDPKVKEMRKLVAQMKADKERLSYDPKEDEAILKEIRERVKSISTTTPYLAHQDELEKMAHDIEETPESVQAEFNMESAETEATTEVTSEIPEETSEETPHAEEDTLS